MTQLSSRLNPSVISTKRSARRDLTCRFLDFALRAPLEMTKGDLHKKEDDKVTLFIAANRIPLI